VRPQLQQQNAATRNLRSRRVTAQQALQGRFASAVRGQNRNFAVSRNNWAARSAWRHRHHASFVPWFGALFWPYAYNDMFYYTFWPDGYEPGYWAYVYDDFFDGIFFPYGAPYVDYAYAGPYARGTTGSARRQEPPGQVNRATREQCADQAKGVTAWPFEQIDQSVRPNDEQKGLLANLKKAADQAADRFREACPDNVPLTPPGRLQAMTMRLQATLDAVKTVRPALEAFYNSLSDEQKARFNDIAPTVARNARRGDNARNEQADCSGEKAGLSTLAIERIEQALNPNDAQYAALERLDKALQKAVDALREACPTTVPLTPIGRIEVMQKRLEAMIEAANTVQPALEEFYASLDAEQKAKFNRLGRETASR
jgi:hypothetical protein